MGNPTTNCKPSSAPSACPGAGDQPLNVDPLPFTLLHPLTMVHKTRRRVRGRAGEHLRTLHVLEPVSSSSTPHHPAHYVPTYAIHKVLNQQASTGVTLLLAYRVQPQNDQDAFLVVYGEPVVIKAMPQPEKSNADYADSPLSEVAAMQLLAYQASHPNLIHYLDCMQDNDFIYLVLPYLSGGDLFSRVEAAGGHGLPEEEVAYYFRQMCEGLLYMKQTLGLAHHDVSLENVMLDGKHDRAGAKIIDLGMCLRVPKLLVLEEEEEQSYEQTLYLKPQPCRGKLGYISPETVREDACDPFAADVWALGMSLYAMSTGHPLYTNPQDSSFKIMANGRVRQVVDSYEKYGLVLSPMVKDLVCRMLHADARQRPTLEEVLTHPLLTQGGVQSPMVVDEDIFFEQ